MTRKSKQNDERRVPVDAAEMKSVLMEQKDFLLPVVQEAVQTILEVELEECLQAGKYERSAERAGYRSGYYRRRLITRVGTLVLRVPQDRAGHFSTQVVEQYQRSEKALVAALAQMYVQGVSTRKVAAITEELCGHEFSASSISAITARLDAQLAEFSRRPLEAEFPYVVVDARYERVREGGVIVSRAILIALGIDWEGRRQVLAVEYANRESQGSWKDFLLQLRQRGLHGVQFVVSDDHPGLKAAIPPRGTLEPNVEAVGSHRNAEKILKKDQVADLLQVTSRTIDSYMRRRLIPYFKIGRTVRFREKDLMDHLRNNWQVGR